MSGLLHARQPAAGPRGVDIDVSHARVTDPGTQRGLGFLPRHNNTKVVKAHARRVIVAQADDAIDQHCLRQRVFKRYPAAIMGVQEYRGRRPIWPLWQRQIPGGQEHGLAWLAQAQASPAGKARPIHLAGSDLSPAIIAAGSAKTLGGIGIHGEAAKACHAGFLPHPPQAGHPLLALTWPLTQQGRSALPHGAEKARPARLHNALDPWAVRLAWAGGAGFPFTAINREILLKPPNLAIGTDVIPQA